jgi:hypothetical protein
LKDVINQILVMLLQTRVTADVNPRFEHDINRFIVFTAGSVEIPVLEIDFSGLE